MPKCFFHRPQQNDGLPEALVAFCKALEVNGNLQGRVMAAENPWQIIDVAAGTGYEISFPELRLWSRELTADYFPWAMMGSQGRRKFFMSKC